MEIPTPAPGPGEVLLKVDAAGLCHSDLHLMELAEESLPYSLPFTLGHETAGTVVALGSGRRWRLRGRPCGGARALGLRPMLGVSSGHGEPLRADRR